MSEWKDGLYCEITPRCYTISVKKKVVVLNFELNRHLAFSANMCGVLGRVSQQGRAWSVPVFPCFSQKVSCLVHHSMANNWLHVTKTPNSKHVSFVLVVSQTCNHAPKLTAWPWLHSSFLKLKSFSEMCKDLDQLEKWHVQISCWSLPSISSWRNHRGRKIWKKMPSNARRKWLPDF